MVQGGGRKNSRGAAALPAPILPAPMSFIQLYVRPWLKIKKEIVNASKLKLKQQQNLLALQKYHQACLFLCKAYNYLSLGTYWLVKYFGQETAKDPFRSSSKAATCYYQLNHSKGRGNPVQCLAQGHNKGTCRPIFT